MQHAIRWVRGDDTLVRHSEEKHLIRLRELVALALPELLSDERQYCRGLGIRKNGKYSCVLDQYISGDGEFSDLKVVALTNFECISGGDAVSLYLSKLPNVTLAGITDPNGSGQETGGLCILSDGIVSVGYPTGLILDEKGELFNDTRADRLSRNAAEVRIPLDKAAAMSIFRDKKDYVDVPLKKLKLRSGILIASIARGNELIIPKGDDCLQVNDSVVVITTTKGMHDLSNIFD